MSTYSERDPIKSYSTSNYFANLWQLCGRSNKPKCVGQISFAHFSALSTAAQWLLPGKIEDITCELQYYQHNAVYASTLNHMFFYFCTDVREDFLTHSTV